MACIAASDLAIIGVTLLWIHPKSGFLTAYEQDAQQAKVALEKKIAQIVLHTKQEEEQYKAEQVIHHQVRSSSRYLKQPWWNAFRLLTVMTG